MTIEKTLQLFCLIVGTFCVTVTLPELAYYAAPRDVAAYTVGLIFAGAGIRSVLKG